MGRHCWASDKIGQVFGQLKILGTTGKAGVIRALCLSCGKETLVYSYSIKSGRTQRCRYCGSIRSKETNAIRRNNEGSWVSKNIGTTYDNAEIIGFYNAKVAKMKCLLCGLEFEANVSNVRRNRVLSCVECSRKKYGRMRSKCPSMPSDICEKRLKALCHAIDRCTNTKDIAWKRYGGRGIQVCKEWSDDHSKFLSYIKDIDGWDDKTKEIDRIDNDGNYEPGNIRFVSKKENTRNRATNRIITHNGMNMTLTEFYETYIPYRCVDIESVRRWHKKGMLSNEIINRAIFIRDRRLHRV